MDSSLVKSLEVLLENYSNDDLTNIVCNLQTKLANRNINELGLILNEDKFSKGTLNAAMEIKAVMGQVNVIVHALGIINSLPYILEENETIESVSLGADNSRSEFDLVTNKRVAEFKFIAWKGNDSVRKQTTFADFYELAEYNTDKEKYLYLIDSSYFIKFLNGKGRISSVLSKNTKILTEIRNKYGERYSFINEYFNDNKGKVNIVSLKQTIPNLFE